MGPRNHALDGILILQGEGAILAIVRFIEKHLENLLQCIQEMAELVEMPFWGPNYMGQKEPCRFRAESVLDESFCCCKG